MTRQIRIKSKSIGEVAAELVEEKNPKTAKAIWDALPIESSANRWGDEVYFDIPVKVEAENAQQDVEIGDIAYWPGGNGFCIFFGPTPVSKGESPRAYSPVNVFGRVVEDPSVFRRVKTGEKIQVIRA